jgi:hypothetical protein
MIMALRVPALQNASSTTDMVLRSAATCCYDAQPVAKGHNQTTRGKPGGITCLNRHLPATPSASFLVFWPDDPPLPIGPPTQRASRAPQPPQCRRFGLRPERRLNSCLVDLRFASKASSFVSATSPMRIHVGLNASRRRPWPASHEPLPGLQRASAATTFSKRAVNSQPSRPGWPFPVSSQTPAPPLPRAFASAAIAP